MAQPVEVRLQLDRHVVGYACSSCYHVFVQSADTTAAVSASSSCAAANAATHDITNDLVYQAMSKQPALSARHNLLEMFLHGVCGAVCPDVQSEEQRVWGVGS